MSLRKHDIIPTFLASHALPLKPLTFLPSKCSHRPHMTTSPLAPQTATTLAQTTLLDHLNTLNLGRAIANNPSAQRETDNLIQQLEALNPTPNPTSNALLGGKWRLVYSTSKQVIGAGKPRWLQPVVSLQYVDLEKGTVVNEEILEFLGGVKWRNCVEGVIEVVSGKRFNVFFKRFDFNGWFGVKAPERFRGWQDITYLEDGVRVARGNRDNVFVLVREE